MQDQSQTLSGSITYHSKDGVQNGVEHFSITQLPNGGESLNASCEIWDDDLVRHCSLTLDAAAQPIQAYVQTFEQGRLEGAAHYRFGEKDAQRFVYPSGDIERLDRPLSFFGTHALINDGWLAKALPPGRDEALIETMATCSLKANGGGAPGLLPTSARIVRGSREHIDVACGAFEVEHYSVGYGEFPPLDMWVCVKTGVLVRLAWDFTGESFQLSTLANAKAALRSSRPS